MTEGDTLKALEFKFTAEVKLKEGLSFIFTALEAMSDCQSHLLPTKLARLSHGEDPLPIISARLLYFDRVDDENINMIAVRDQVCVAEPHDISTTMKGWFKYYMSHGLSQQDRELCADRYCSGIGELCSEVNAKTPEFGSRNIHFYFYREGLRQSPNFKPENILQGLEFFYHVGDGMYRKAGWSRPGEKPIVVSSACCCECVICWDELPVGGMAIQLECSHYFHLHCIVQWINMAHTCPLCRFHVSGSDFYFGFPYRSVMRECVAPCHHIEEDD